MNFDLNMVYKYGINGLLKWNDARGSAYIIYRGRRKWRTWKWQTIKITL